MNLRAVLLLLLLLAAVVGALQLMSADPAAPDADVDWRGQDLEALGATLTGRDLGAAPGAQDDGVGTARLFGTIRRGGLPAGDVFVGLARLAPLAWNADGASMRMVDSEGRPHVHIPPLSNDTRSGIDGAYAFLDLRPGRYALVVGPERARRVLPVEIPIDGSAVRRDIDQPGGDASMRGRAQHHDGRAFQGRLALHPVVANAWLDIATEAERTVVTRTSRDGRFEASGLEPGLYLVAPITSVATPHIGPFVVPHEGEHVIWVDTAEVAFAPEVRSATTGLPIAGAAVRVGPEIGPTTTVTTDDQGCATIGLPDAPGRYVVAADGYITVVALTNPWDPDPTLEPQIRLWPTGRLQGTVTDPQGNAVPGAPVFAFGDGATDNVATDRPRPLDPRLATLSDAQGRFVFEAVAPGLQTVFVLGGGHMTPGLAEATLDGYNPLAVEVEPAATTQVDLIVAPAPQIRGRVQDAEGRPVPGATVWCVRSVDVFNFGRADLNEAHWFEHKQPVLADDDGRFRFGCVLPETQVLLGASAPEHLPFESGTVVLHADGGVEGDPRINQAGTREVLLRLPARRLLDVRVIDAQTRAPLPGVHVRTDSAQMLFWSLQGIPSLTAIRQRWLSAYTDADGGARLWTEEATPKHVAVRASGYVPVSRAMSPDGGAVEIELVRAKGLTGTLELPDDIGEGSWVELVAYQGRHDPPGDWPESGGRFDRLEDFVSDASGTPPPRTVHAPTASQEGEVFVPHLEPDETITLFVAVSASDRRLVGHVVLASTSTGFSVSLDEVPSKPTPEDDTLQQTLVLQVDPTIDLTRAKALGIPLDRNGAPLGFGQAWYRVRGGRATGTFARALTAEVVWYVFPGGTGARGHRLAAPVVHGPVSSAQAETSVTLSTARVQQGRIRADDGAPVRGARVTATPVLDATSPTWGWRNEGHAAAVTDARGRFTLNGLGDFEYDLHLGLPPGFALAQPRRQTPDDAVLELVVNRARPITVELSTPEGEPLVGATVSAGWLREGEFVELTDAKTNDEGRVSLEGLDPEGTYELSIVGRTLRPVRDLALSMRAWTFHQTRLEVQPVTQPQLDVQDPSGTRVVCNGAWRVPGRGWQWFRVGENPWALPAVPVGVELEVRFEGDALAPTTVTAVPGALRWIAVARVR